MLQTLGEEVGFIVQIRAEKGENCYSEDSFMMQYVWRRKRSFPIKASSGKTFSRSVKETIFLWLHEGLLPRCCSHKSWGSGIEGRQNTCRQKVGLTALSFLQMAPSWLLTDEIAIINHSPHPNSRACFQILAWLLRQVAWIAAWCGTAVIGTKNFARIPSPPKLTTPRHYMFWNIHQVIKKPAEVCSAWSGGGLGKLWASQHLGPWPPASLVENMLSCVRLCQNYPAVQHCQYSNFPISDWHIALCSGLWILGKKALPNTRSYSHKIHTSPE